VVATPDVVFARFLALCEEALPQLRALTGVGSVAARVRGLFDRVRRAPIPAPAADPPGSLTYADLLLALFAPIRNPALWPRLAKDLEAAIEGDASALETQARAGRAPGAWSEATTSTAIQCADGPARESSHAWPGVVGRLDAISTPGGSGLPARPGRRASPDATRVRGMPPRGRRSW
jgi:hypothetical protein